VFEPLFTTKAPGVGTGLGLSICRELVQQVGGEIRLKSTVGIGTTVEITLQKAAQPQS
jgi:signal transduction histidine kinase